eukprot:3834197-Rhodomonas_salina.2
MSNTGHRWLAGLPVSAPPCVSNGPVNKSRQLRGRARKRRCTAPQDPRPPAASPGDSTHYSDSSFHPSRWLPPSGSPPAPFARALPGRPAVTSQQSLKRPARSALTPASSSSSSPSSPAAETRAPTPLPRPPPLPVPTRLRAPPLPPVLSCAARRPLLSWPCCPQPREAACALPRPCLAPATPPPRAPSSLRSAASRSPRAPALPSPPAAAAGTAPRPCPSSRSPSGSRDARPWPGSGAHQRGPRARV